MTRRRPTPLPCLAAGLLLIAGTASAQPRVGMWLHPDLELDEWICRFETRAEPPPLYVHSKILPSAWRHVVAHSSVVVLNNFIFADPLPWTVFGATRTYAEYVADLDAFPASSPEGIWWRRLNDHLRTPLAAHFGLGDHEMIYCGMALGYADMSKPVNTLRSDRAPVDEIAVFKGF